MTFSISTGLRRKVLESGWLTAFTTPEIEIRDGTPPASADEDETGTLFCTITLPATGYFSISGDEILQAGTWSGTTGKYGTPTWFRLKNSGDGGGVSTSLPRLDGTIGNIGDGADMQFDRLPVEMEELITVIGLTITAQDALPRFEIDASGGVEEAGAIALTASATMTASGTVA